MGNTLMTIPETYVHKYNDGSYGYFVYKADKEEIQNRETTDIKIRDVIQKVRPIVD